MRVLITDITGFAGSHLAELLLAERGVEVFGTVRWRSRLENVVHILDKVRLVECDLRDRTSVDEALAAIRPDRIFHLAAQSFVPTSWNAPQETMVTNVIGQINLLEAARQACPRARILCARSAPTA